MLKHPQAQDPISHCRVQFTGDPVSHCRMQFTVVENLLKEIKDPSTFNLEGPLLSMMAEEDSSFEDASTQSESERTFETSSDDGHDDAIDNTYDDTSTNEDDSQEDDD